MGNLVMGNLVMGKGNGQWAITLGEARLLVPRSDDFGEANQPALGGSNQTTNHKPQTTNNKQ
jgi:hypothetical protein